MSPPKTLTHRNDRLRKEGYQNRVGLVTARTAGLRARHEAAGREAERHVRADAVEFVMGRSLGEGGGKAEEVGPDLVHAFHWQSGEVGGHGRKARQHGIVDGGEIGRSGASADFAALFLGARADLRHQRNYGQNRPRSHTHRQDSQVC
jgi:hypothetical protein